LLKQLTTCFVIGNLGYILGKSNEHYHLCSSKMSSQGHTKCDPKRTMEWEEANSEPLQDFQNSYICTKLEQTCESKLEPKNTKCTFVGYSTNSKAYTYINVLREKLILSQDVIFNKIVISSLRPLEKTT
jgi:hypothetical protein